MVVEWYSLRSSTYSVVAVVEQSADIVLSILSIRKERKS
jgi:hypothetical protein